MPVEIESTEIVKDSFFSYKRRGTKNTRCVVFVHGVTGHITDTWRKDVTSKSGFVELVCHDTELQDYDVFAFGYRSGFFRGAPIDNAAVQLRTALSYLEAQRYDIVFIAHSMGGLVCMKYIVDALQRSEVPRVTGLLLFGTPTTGSDLINIAKLVGYGVGLKIPGVSMAVNFFSKSQQQITDLATGSKFLSDLHTEWAYRVVNGGHEQAGTQRMWLPVRVVTGEDDFAVKEASGKSVYGAIDWQPLSYGHIQLVKPESANDPRFLAAKSFLQIARRIDPQILDRVWKASQEIWANRFGRVSEKLEFFTAIDAEGSNKTLLEGQLAGDLSAYGKCETVCQYDFILEKEYVEFGVSFGDNDLWKRQSPPIYIHQIGLNLLPQAEKNRLRSSVDEILTMKNDDEIWSLFFPKVSIAIDGVALTPDAFEWPVVAKRYANWLLRKYSLPEKLRPKLGTKAKLVVTYESFVPTSLPHFVFSAPWIIHGATVRVVVGGDFEYFVPSYRLVPPGKADQSEDATEKRREATFGYGGIMLPGSAVEVRWQKTLKKRGIAK